MIIYPDSSAPTFGRAMVTIEDLLLGVEMDGVAWVFEELDGWSMGGGVQTGFAPRPTAHGAFDAPVYRRERIVTISGVCVAATEALAEAASDALAATLADGRMGTFTVTSNTRTLSARVRLSDTPQSAWISDTAFRWSLQFTAPDHRKYGNDVTVDTTLPGSASSGLVFPVTGGVFDFGTVEVAGRVSVVNLGTSATEPVFTVRGPLASGFEITHVESGRRLRYAGTVGGDVVLDARTGRASVEGQDRSGNLTVREWPVIPAKSEATFAFATLGSETHFDDARMSVTASPAYF